MERSPLRSGSSVRWPDRTPDIPSLRFLLQDSVDEFDASGVLRDRIAFQADRVLGLGELGPHGLGGGTAKGPPTTDGLVNVEEIRHVLTEPPIDRSKVLRVH